MCSYVYEWLWVWCEHAVSCVNLISGERWVDILVCFLRNKIETNTHRHFFSHPSEPWVRASHPFKEIRSFPASVSPVDSRSKEQSCLVHWAQGWGGGLIRERCWVGAERTGAPECAVGFFPWPLSLTLPSEERDPPCCSTLEPWCWLPRAPETLLGVWARVRGAELAGWFRESTRGVLGEWPLAPQVPSLEAKTS